MGEHNWWFSHYYEKDVFYIQKVLLYFVHVIFIANQATWEKNLVAIESVAFSFSVNCSFNNTFSLEISGYSFISMKFQDFCTGLMFDWGIFV